MSFWTKASTSSPLAIAWHKSAAALVRSDALFAILAFAFVGGDGVENGILRL